MFIVALTALLALAAPGDDPAGQQLTAWLTAFNSNDQNTLVNYHDHHFPYSVASRDVDDVESEIRLGRATGGFEIRKVEQVTAFRLTAYLKERSRPGFARVRLEVESRPPYKMLSFDIGPIPASDELLTPEERVLQRVDPAKRRRLIKGIARELQAHYVYPEVAKRMVAAIQKHDADGDYDALVSAAPLAERLADDLRAESHDRHLRVILDAPQSPAPGAAAPLPPMPADFGFGPIARMEGNVGHVVVNEFVRDDEQVRQAIGRYMSQVADADALLLDLRQNGGGDPATVAVVASYFFDETPVHIDDMYRRDTGETRQSWTLARVAGKRFGARKPVYVLTSNRTFSGGEALTYDLQSLRRAVIVGETTGGGAHPEQPYPLADGFVVLVPWGRPINPVTKTNWEGTGVVPDVKVSAPEALSEAHRLALAELKRRSGGAAAQKEPPVSK